MTSHQVLDADLAKPVSGPAQNLVARREQMEPAHQRVDRQVSDLVPDVLERVHDASAMLKVMEGGSPKRAGEVGLPETLRRAPPPRARETALRGTNSGRRGLAWV